jgi:hypothetical protein
MIGKWADGNWKSGELASNSIWARNKIENDDGGPQAAVAVDGRSPRWWRGTYSKLVLPKPQHLLFIFVHAITLRPAGPAHSTLGLSLPPACADERQEMLKKKLNGRRTAHDRGWERAKELNDSFVDPDFTRLLFFFFHPYKCLYHTVKRNTVACVESSIPSSRTVCVPTFFYRQKNIDNAKEVVQHTIIGVRIERSMYLLLLRASPTGVLYYVTLYVVPTAL